jgi:hypothetical protein
LPPKRLELLLVNGARKLLLPSEEGVVDDPITDDAVLLLVEFLEEAPPGVTFELTTPVEYVDLLAAAVLTPLGKFDEDEEDAEDEEEVEEEDEEEDEEELFD